MLDSAVEYVVNSYAALLDGKRYSKNVARACGANATKSLRLALANVDRESTLDYALAMKLHFNAEVACHNRLMEIRLLTPPRSF